jgi:hypothetical protein
MNGFEEGANQARLFFDKENRKVGPRMKECNVKRGIETKEPQRTVAIKGRGSVTKAKAMRRKEEKEEEARNKTRSSRKRCEVP